MSFIENCTTDQLIEAFVRALNRKQYAVLLLLIPSEDASIPEVVAEREQGFVGIHGNVETPEKQVELLRAVASRIEASKAEIAAKLKAQKRKARARLN